MVFIVVTMRLMHLINMRGLPDIWKHGVRGMSHGGWETQFCGSIFFYHEYNFRLCLQ